MTNRHHFLIQSYSCRYGATEWFTVSTSGNCDMALAYAATVARETGFACRVIAASRVVLWESF